MYQFMEISLIFFEEKKEGYLQLKKEIFLIEKKLKRDNFRLRNTNRYIHSKRDFYLINYLPKEKGIFYMKKKKPK